MRNVTVQFRNNKTARISYERATQTKQIKIHYLQELGKVSGITALPCRERYIDDTVKVDYEVSVSEDKMIVNGVEYTITPFAAAHDERKTKLALYNKSAEVGESARYGEPIWVGDRLMWVEGVTAKHILKTTLVYLRDGKQMTYRGEVSTPLVNRMNDGLLYVTSKQMPTMTLAEAMREIERIQAENHTRIDAALATMTFTAEPQPTMANYKE